MKAEISTAEDAILALKKEIMLHVNQRLFESETISAALYEQAKAKILNLKV